MGFGGAAHRWDRSCHLTVVSDAVAVNAWGFGMGWDFETEPEFQAKLDWVDRFLTEEIQPLDHVLGNPYDKTNRRTIDYVKPLQQQVQERGLWACHLGGHLGGQGYGQVKLALMNEILGR